MEIVVCIKQVPNTDRMETDTTTGSLIRESAGTKINPYDMSAIEAALQIRESLEGKIHAITMGPKQARSVLREALALQVDSAWHVADKCFAGADVLATAYTLAQSISKITKADIIVCGKQSTDGDTSQVGPELAEFLGISHAAYVTKINEITEKYVIVTCSMNTYEETVKLSLPCLISVEKESFVPRFCTYKNKLEAQKKTINYIDINNLEDNNPDNYGYKGSATRVNKLYAKKIVRDPIIISGETEEIVDTLKVKIKDWGLNNESLL